MLTECIDEQSYTFDLPTGLIWKYRIYHVIPELWGHYIRPCYQRNTRADTKRAMVGDSDNIGEENEGEEEWSLLPFYRWGRSRPAAELEAWVDDGDGIEMQEGLPTGNR
jgi:hypothetical protein